MEFDSHNLIKPNTSEAECRRSTSAEVLHPLILGFLQTITGLNEWEVRVKMAEVEDVGEFLTIKAEVNMSIPKAKFGTEPAYTIERKSDDPT